MPIILSSILISFATITLLIVFNVLRSSERGATHNIYFCIYCITSSIWLISCAVMGLSDSVQYAYFVRGVMLLGVFLTQNMSIQLICIWLNINNPVVKHVRYLIIIISLLVFPTIVTGNNVEFNQTYYGMYYKYKGITFGRCFFNIYLVWWALFILVIVIYALRRTQQKRKIFIARIILVCLGMMVLGSISDVIMPMFGFDYFPACAMEQFFSMILIYIVSNYYNVTQVTIKNVSEYIYRVVEAPIVVTDEDGAIEIINASAGKFFEVVTDRLLGTDFFSLFAISSQDIQRYRSKGVISVSTEAECLLNGARCSLNISHIYDRFDEIMGDIIVITDLTDKLEMIDELNRSREKTIQAMEAKSAFLANISHEIRTPLNAIIGMSELLMKRELPIEIHDELSGIYSASKGLAATLNDFLDYSKIEMGHFEIVEREYSFSELMFDIANIIGMRLIGRPVSFFIEVQHDVPIKMIGDDIRLKQILINILVNAVKFTSKGYIKLMITTKRVEEDKIELLMSVEDTGIGIKEEDIPMLFQRFRQVDTKRNSCISGTGLGLAITKELVEMMGGEIQVESTYGEGTTFYWTICQKIKDLVKYDIFEKKRERTFIVYEEEQAVKDHIVWILKELQFEFVVIDRVDKVKELNRNIYFMTRSMYYDKLSKRLKSYNLGKHLIIILSIGENKNRKFNGFLQFFMPLLQKELISLCLSKNPFPQSNLAKAKKVDLQLAPDTEVLVVDDNETNLVIAEGLLSSYQIKIDKALSGKDAIEMVKRKRYHLIFLDQMMPGIDGLETLMQIRNLPGSYYQNVPIVALSAYAIKDAKKYFMEQGFSDFLAKPIELRYLEQIVMTYLKDSEELHRLVDENINEHDHESQEQVATARESEEMERVNQIDMESAIAALGGNESMYRIILDAYYKDIMMKRKEIPEILEREDYKLFTIQVHAIKSASKSIGAMSFSGLAEHFEKLGKNQEIELIQVEVPKLYEEMDELILELEHILKE